MCDVYILYPITAKIRVLVLKGVYDMIKKLFLTDLGGIRNWTYW